MAGVTADESLRARSSITAQLAGSIDLTGDSYSVSAIWNDSAFISACALFESVELVSASVVLSVAPLETGFVQLAFAPSSVGDDGKVTTTATGISTSLHYVQTFVSKEQPINLSLELPVGHNFGHELKGATLGNPRPILAWRIRDTPEAAAKSITGRIHYKYTLLAHGRAPPSAATR